MSGAVDCRAALEARLAAIASPLATQWENVDYEPIADTPYQTVALLLALPNNPEAGGTFYQESGFLQVDLRYPRKAGAGAATAKAEAVRSWFPKGLTLTANGLNVTIDRTPAILPGFFEADRFVIPVRISFYSNNPS